MVGGRKLEFDKDKALEAAMRVFWKKGFLGASLTDLTKGMGINKPSLYATFGNKESLFIQTTNYYVEKYAKPKVRCLHEPDLPLKVRLKNYLMMVVAGQCDENTPRGCYVSLCIVESAGETMPLDALKTIQQVGAFLEIMLTEFFQNDKESKILELDVDAENRALFLATIINGTAAMARAGKSLKDLESVIDHALQGVFS